MDEQGFNYVLERVNSWVGLRLSTSQVNDGVCYYSGREKILKVIRQRHGWHIQFNLPVPECEGLLILSQEEARAKKLGKSRWIYRGFSEQVAEELVGSALSCLPRRRVIDPAMSRDIITFYGFPGPNFREIENLLNKKTLPFPVAESLHQAYELLQQRKYVDFAIELKKVVEEIVTFLLQEHNLVGVELSFKEKVSLLEARGIISHGLRDEINVLFIRETTSQDYSNQEKAYPLALLLIVLMSKLLKACG